jgi:hypothetical protein
MLGLRADGAAGACLLRHRLNFCSVDTVVKNQDGRRERRELFCSGVSVNPTTTPEGIRHTWQSTPSPAGWTNIWDDLKIPPGGNQAGYDVHLDMACRLLLASFSAGDHRLWRVVQNVPNGGWTPWGAVNNNVFFDANDVTIAQNRNGRLDLFTVETNSFGVSNLDHNLQSP